MFSQAPIFADVLKPKWYPVLKSSTTNAITISTAFGTNYGAVAIMPQHYFVFTNFRVRTNYDNFGGIITTAAVVAAKLISPPFVPNNFTVQIVRGQNNRFSNTPLTQAQICSSGYLAGKQMPIPTIYGPSETFQFTFTDTTGLLALDTSDNPISLQIQMFMEGYQVQIGESWKRFLNYFPALRAIYP